MNNPTSKQWSAGMYFIALIGTFLIMAWLVAFVRKYTLPPPLNQARVQERLKILAEAQAADAEALNNYGWVDQGMGLVRLPMARAMELTIAEWKKPALARSNLLALAEKAAATPPPAPPPKNPFE